MACKQPCDGFKNNINNGLTGSETDLRICTDCDYNNDTDQSNFKVRCTKCNDNGVYYSRDSWAEAYPQSPGSTEAKCDCRN